MSIILVVNFLLQNMVLDLSDFLISTQIKRTQVSKFPDLKVKTICIYLFLSQLKIVLACIMCYNFSLSVSFIWNVILLFHSQDRSDEVSVMS